MHPRQAVGQRRQQGSFGGDVPRDDPCRIVGQGEVVTHRIAHVPGDLGPVACSEAYVDDQHRRPDLGQVDAAVERGHGEPLPQHGVPAGQEARDFGRRDSQDSTGGQFVCRWVQGVQEGDEQQPIGARDDDPVGR